MYDVDGNGYIDLVEMTKLVKSIYAMMGPSRVLQEHHESAEDRAKEIFIRMDKNADGRVTREEFIQSCSVDQKLIQLLTPNTL